MVKCSWYTKFSRFIVGKSWWCKGKGMEYIISWLVELNKTNHLGFAFLTVFVMALVGSTIALLIELVFAAIGIKSDRSKSQH